MKPSSDHRFSASTDVFAIVAAFLGLIAISNQAAAQRTPVVGFELIRDSQSVRVEENGRPVLTYQFGEQQIAGKKPYRRAHYLHPLCDLTGKVATEDFPGDHLHHRGIFWAWHQVLVGDQSAGDAWICTDFRWESQSVTTNLANGMATIQGSVVWRSPQIVDASKQPVPIANDEVIISVHPLANEARKIDFTIRLQALLPNVQIGGSDDDKGYGGFSTRLRMPDDLQFISQDGPVKPTKLAVTAGRAMLFRAADFSYAVLVSANNPGETNQWILRQKRSMQNPVFPGRQCVPLSQSEPTVLKYRVVMLPGGHDRECDLTEMLADFDALQ